MAKAQKKKNTHSAKNGLLGGAPRAKIDMEQIEILCQYPCSAQWIADFFKVHLNTILNLIREETGLTWHEFNERFMAKTRFSLMQAAVDQAKAGNAKSLAMCLKKYCDWDTKRDADVHVINNLMTNEQLDQEIIGLLKELNLKI